ncbi:uncharacterized protein LOC131179442 [Hevea brasiliensis]|uniref:uncharacterized protein LOC131179442 n=1 Tax=Hevea brasiliensis TaxID=3981 RepID=UPI0025DE70B1|nr:uncharacterized protein LOC131179442 [Hevea brasiliensis]
MSPLYLFHKDFRGQIGQVVWKVFESFTKLIINIPFTKALSQVPSYVKFLKEILSKMKKIEDYETVALMEEYNAILRNKLALKLKDLGSFSILCDLGANKFFKYPISILDNILIKVGKFFSTIDFVVLEMEEDVQIPIKLGRPFLATTEAIIYVQNGWLTLKVGDEEVEFNLC